MVDDYRKGWALRYLREAKDEIRASTKNLASLDLIIDAARKAQAAIYFVLGDPISIQSIVNQALLDGKPVENPVLRCLVGIERAVQRMESLHPSRHREALKDAEEIVNIASDIVDLITSED
ncbi:MAG: hypothetical protein RMJ07_04060 [Nitrososphaerota archaeon]|nr:hypothetical protein [Candidatus Bathyarchaeota archaeon]MDW8048838.1 hypothetical protein [Nitrososphaerota archaeon]